MDERLTLQTDLETILGSRNVYFQPPASVRLNYPGIVYKLVGMDAMHANDMMYRGTKRYELIVIDYDPDSQIFREILSHFPMCSFDRTYVADNLNHWVLTLYH